ncbi:unnamed protein product [Bemisia tabaci]|uniref:Sulfotransferase domain-containing protein n=1 Tax=Bemisia tabaci TaxID=7038 RepID=A0A9P0AGS1_BEMTA|nr:unnamed protein product [Bemisia tabaci]
MFPHTVKNVEPQINEKLLSHFKGEREGFIQVGDEKWLVPARYARHASGYYQFPLKMGDVWIMTFPRSGTTWCQELIWLLNNNLDYKKSAAVALERRSPFLEFSIIHDPKHIQDLINLNDNSPDVVAILKERSTPGYELFKDLPSPRTIKTHLPFSLLPPTLLETNKIVYVARHPKDVFVSYYHHNKLVTIHGYHGDMLTYWKFFKNNLVCFSPYWEHLNQAWEHRNHPNMLFLFYENLVKDLPSGVREIAQFLNMQYSDEQFRQLVEHLQIDNFRRRVPLYVDVEIKGIFGDTEEGFVRKGKVGGGDPELTAELSREIDEWIEMQLQNTDLRFPDKK